MNDDTVDHDDRDLIACFNIIYDLFPEAFDDGLNGFAESVPSPVESREALRLFARIPSPEMRTAVRMLMLALDRRPATSADPICRHPPVASRPN